MPRKVTAKPEISPALVMPAKADGTAFWVPSRTQDICYLVEQRGSQWFCRCPARKPCVHLRAVEAKLSERAHGLRQDALAEQQAEAEHLASLPRVLANVETSEIEKLERLAEATVTQRHEAVLTMGQRAERAMLADHTPEYFSIFKA